MDMEVAMLAWELEVEFIMPLEERPDLDIWGEDLLTAGSLCVGACGFTIVDSYAMLNRDDLGAILGASVPFELKDPFWGVPALEVVALPLVPLDGFSGSGLASGISPMDFSDAETLSFRAPRRFALEVFFDDDVKDGFLSFKVVGAAVDAPLEEDDADDDEKSTISFAFVAPVEVGFDCVCPC